MKYIVHRELGFIAFDERHEHKGFALNLGALDDIISGGHIGDHGSGPECYGEAPSIDVSAKKEDTTKLKAMLDLYDGEVGTAEDESLLMALFGPSDAEVREFITDLRKFLENCWEKEPSENGNTGSLDRCWESSVFAAAALTQYTGQKWSVVEGLINCNEADHSCTHYWAESDDLMVDLTGDQFSLNPVLVLSKSEIPNSYTRVGLSTVILGETPLQIAQAKEHAIGFEEAARTAGRWLKLHNKSKGSS